MMFETLDPTHLVALHVLLEERHVTRAAKRLGLTQSSMSHRLRRLRDVFADPLFVRAGGALLPTPRAEEMARPLAQALAALAAAVQQPPVFDPRTSRYTLSVAMPDLLAPLVPRLLASLAKQAPRFDVRIDSVGPRLDEALAAGEPVMALAPVEFAEPATRRIAVGELRFGVVGRRGHPALRRRLGVERWLDCGHVVVRVGNERSNVIQDELTRRGLVRRVALEVPSFLTGLHAVAGSDLLMNAPLPLVADVATRLGLAVREAPVPLPSVRFALLFHERFQHDAAHRFARDVLFDTVSPLFRRLASSPREPLRDR